ncbi:MAG TPA: minor capsid protein [Pseudonocardia sp.]
MTWTRGLLYGVAELLDAAGVGVWRPDSPYQAGETGITIKAVPDQPGRLITLHGYDVAPAPGHSHGTRAVQVRCRGLVDPADVDDLADAIYDQLHNLTGTIGDAPVALMWRQSTANLGPDEAGRWSRSENYYLLTSQPSANSPD